MASLTNSAFRSIFSRERAWAALIAGGVLLGFSILTIPSITSAGGVGYLQLGFGLLLVSLGASELLSEAHRRSFMLLRILSIVLFIEMIFLLVMLSRFWLSMR